MKALSLVRNPPWSWKLVLALLSVFSSGGYYGGHVLGTRAAVASLAALQATQSLLRDETLRANAQEDIARRCTEQLTALTPAAAPVVAEPAPARKKPLKRQPTATPGGAK